MARSSSTPNDTATTPSALDTARDMLAQLATVGVRSSPHVALLRAAIDAQSERAAQAAIDDFRESADGKAAEATAAVRDQLLASASSRAPVSVVEASIGLDGQMRITQRHSLEVDEPDRLLVIAPARAMAILPRLAFDQTLPERMSCHARGVDYATHVARAEALRASRRAGFEAIAAQQRKAERETAHGWPAQAGNEFSRDPRNPPITPNR